MAVEPSTARSATSATSSWPRLTATPLGELRVAGTAACKPDAGMEAILAVLLYYSVKLRHWHLAALLLHDAQQCPWNSGTLNSHVAWLVRGQPGADWGPCFAMR